MKKKMHVESIKLNFIESIHLKKIVAQIVLFIRCILLSVS